MTLHKYFNWTTRKIILYFKSLNYFLGLFYSIAIAPYLFAAYIRTFYIN